MIPNGWNKIRLRDLGTEIRESVKPSPGVEYDMYSVPAFPSGRPEVLLGEQIKSSKRRVAPGDLLLCKINPRINRVWAVSDASGRPQLASSEYLVLRLHEEYAELLRYLIWYLRSPRFRRWIELNVEGATGSHTRAKSPPILEQEVPVAPEHERDALIDVIEAVTARVDSASEELSKVRKKAKVLRRQILTAASVGQLVATSALGKQGFPKHWDVAPLSELCMPKLGLITGPFGSLLKKSDHRDAGIPVVGIPNITEAGFKPGNWFHIDEQKAKELERYSVRAGDLLVSRSGTVGQVCVMPANPARAVMSTNLMRIRLNDASLSEWVAVSIKGSPVIREQLSTLLSGSTRDFLNLTILSQLLVGIPPVNERRRLEMKIEEQLSQLGMVVEGTTLAERRTQTLVQQLLRSAFIGKLRPGVAI